MLSLPLRTPGIALIVFYLLGSSATKRGKATKASLEDGHDGAGAGYRTAAQVFSNSASALVASLLWGALHAPGFPGAKVASAALDVPGKAYHGEWCPLDAGVSGGWSRTLLFIVLGHFACCLGDTLASELGILSPQPPILLTTLRPVPPGTNGGLSLFGTLASFAGGLSMGVTMWFTLIIENAACRGEPGQWFNELALWGAFAGLAGSMLDSLLGATLQETAYSLTRKKVMLEGHGSRPGTPAGEDEEIKVVSGIDVLTNNQVNLISATVMSLALAYFA
ncbi:unnamed protein product [Peniophora sp. CBMAI 1063]|nr:unnamed protein product [Peniophora sp. CBMAI 1063]